MRPTLEHAFHYSNLSILDHILHLFPICVRHFYFHYCTFSVNICGLISLCAFVKAGGKEYSSQWASISEHFLFLIEGQYLSNTLSNQSVLISVMHSFLYVMSAILLPNKYILYYLYVIANITLKMALELEIIFICI